MIDSLVVEQLLHSVVVADKADGKIIEGINNSFLIDVKKHEADRMVVKNWIVQLPTEFLVEGGGGWSFLNLCTQADGRQWTGMHLNCEYLYVLAAGLGLAHFLLPRETWRALPGGVPYLAFTLKDAPEAG